MKISKKPTDWVLVTVSLKDGFNHLDFVLIEMTIQYRGHLRERVDVARAVSHMRNFNNISFWDAPNGWYVYYHEGIEGHLKNSALRWCFIKFDSKTELLELKWAFEHMESEYMSVFADGTAQMCGTPRYQTSEQYSNEFPLEEILNELDAAFGRR